MALATADVPQALRDATEHQPGARAALAAALVAPAHAYLLAGPPGSGKRAAARAFVAELLADGAPEPDDARRRALADPSPHPDLVWLAPQGTQHLVDEVRERVIVAAAYRPFEGARRVFVIEAAEAMADESQNALLKTLEEPPPFAHLVLITSEPAALLETVRSRCQAGPLRAAHRGGRRAAPLGARARRGATRSAGPRRAWPAATRTGRPFCSAIRAGSFAPRLRRASRRRSRASWPAPPGMACSAPPRRRATQAAEAARARFEDLADEAGEGETRGARRRSRETEEATRRAARRARTEALDLGLALMAAWLRDLAAVAEGAESLAWNSDRLEELRAASAHAAGGLDSRRARAGAELVMETRGRLRVNVGEELALEALVFRLEALLRDA